MGPRLGAKIKPKARSRPENGHPIEDFAYSLRNHIGQYDHGDVEDPWPDAAPTSALNLNLKDNHLMSALRVHVSRCPLSSTAARTRTSTRTRTWGRACSNDVRAGACGRARVSSARANFQPLNSANSLASLSSPPSHLTLQGRIMTTPPSKTRSFHVSLPTWTSLLRKRGSDHQTQTGAIQKKPLDAGSESQQRSITTMAAPTGTSTAAAPKDPATHSNYDEISTTHVRLSS